MSEFLKLGEHFICELLNCNQEILFDNKTIKSLFLQVIQEGGLSIVGEGQFEFSPHGFTCYALLEESHASIHIWPEYGYCALDIFTCNLELNLDPLFEIFKDTFEAEHYLLQVIERGLPKNFQPKLKNNNPLSANF